MEFKCVLCKEKCREGYCNWSAPGAVAYFERGLFKNRFLCSDCQDSKNSVKNLYVNESEREKAVNKLTKMVAGQVDEIKSVVEKWIDAENTCYFPELDDLQYYVEGPEAFLFVFTDRVVILSSILEGANESENELHNIDAALLFPNKDNQAGLVVFDDSKTHLGEEEKLNYKAIPGKKLKDAGTNNLLSAMNSLGGFGFSVNERNEIYAYPMSSKNQGLTLEPSLGDYGSLKLELDGRYYIAGCSYSVFDFSFFYHQNALMEEVYNYIKSRMLGVSEEKNEETHNESVSKVSYISTKKQPKENTSISIADEIEKLKKLLDIGALTPEEFSEAKRKLLDKM